MYLINKNGDGKHINDTGRLEQYFYLVHMILSLQLKPPRWSNDTIHFVVQSLKFIQQPNVEVCTVCAVFDTQWVFDGWLKESVWLVV